MSFRSIFRSPLSVLAMASIATGAFILFSQSGERTGSEEGLPEEGLPEEGLPEECRSLTPQECLEKLGMEGTRDPVEGRRMVLRAEDACVRVGYLCAELESNESMTLLRWPTGTQQIRIWVPEPTHLPSDLSREFQRAAVRGIQAWHGHPAPLSIRTREVGEPPDITVDWVRTLDDNRLGRAEVEWTQRGADVEVRVLGLTIATYDPGNEGQELTLQQVELVAAHEMGHALGLPHSDDPRDVMFPRNTATRLTARDFRTLEAFYSLPNGAEIRR